MMALLLRFEEATLPEVINHRGGENLETFVLRMPLVLELAEPGMRMNYHHISRHTQHRMHW